MIEVIPDGGVTTPAGFQAGAAMAGIKYPDRLDLALIHSHPASAAAGVFTRNQVVAAPVTICRETLAVNREAIAGVVANAGNANACTGRRGLDAAREMQRLASVALGCRPQQVLVLSTGVIGVQLPIERVADGIRAAATRLAPGGGNEAARAIMTTDTRPKEAALLLTLPEGKIQIGGMAKGAGMIHPDMATMLAVVTTDARVEPGLLQHVLASAVARSFNRISVDGDTSTNDTLLLLANGASGVTVRDGEALDLFSTGVTQLCADLAQQIVRDGEGATRFVTIAVRGAPSDEDAHRIANTIATSPLVKTAIAGGDANWGRILAAAGRAGVPFSQERVQLCIGQADAPMLQLVAGGEPTDYAEEQAAEIFSGSEIELSLVVGQGAGEATVWTCDLTHEYVSINADYRS